MTLFALSSALLLSGCVVTYDRIDDTSSLPQARVISSISTLLDQNENLIRDKRVGLLTNSSGVDEKKRTTLSLLRSDPRAVSANVYVAALFAPEHGLQANEDRTNLPSGTDRETGLPIYSLYGAQTQGPPDSVLMGLHAIIIDLPDVGSRTWTYQGAMIYTMRAAARLGKKVIVLDRPNPLTGAVVEGPMLDSNLANADDPAPGKPGRAYALHPIPLRHGMTIGELARMYNSELKIGADLTVIKMRGWRRELWFDRTGLPFIKPSPNLPTLQSVMLYPALVPFESSNLSVGRGTEIPFQRIGAPWLNPKEVIRVLKDQKVLGVRFTEESFKPSNPGDGKYAGQTIPGITITTTNRTNLQTARVTAALLSAIQKIHGDKLELKEMDFDLRFGSTQAREEITRGMNPDAVIDKLYGAVYAFRQRAKPFLLY